VTGYVLTGERRYLTSYENARRELPEAVVELGGLVSDNPGQVDHVERVRALVDQRAGILEALVANVRANRPAATRVELLDQNKETGDALIGRLQAMEDTEQRLLSARQAEARRARTLALGAIGLSVLLGIAGGIAAVLLFTSGVTRRAARLEQNAERLFGYTQAQVLGTPGFWTAQLHPEDRERFTAMLERAIAERAPQLEQEYRFLLQGGYRWLYGVTRFVYDDDGALADTLSYAMDVTERRRADDAIREREATLQAVIKASPDIITILDAGGRMRPVSPAAERILGRPPDERVGRSALSSEFVHPDDLKQFRETQRRVLTGQDESAEVRVRVRHAEGHWVTLEAHSRPLAAPDGLLVVSRDVTGQAALEEDLRLAKLAAEQANEAKSEYLSRMSHELRTPLNAILGFAKLLDLDDLGDEQRDNLGHIMSGARHLLSLINEVLDIAAIEAGRLTLSLEPVALADVAAETVSLIRPLADQHHIVLAGPSLACTTHVLGDRQRLKQVLLNLLSNAVKYNREGGSVRLDCEPVPEGRLRIKVTDTGLGIPPEAIGRLFVPFERVASQPSAIEGTGLGLPLSKRLAEAMGGNLEVSTTVGQGSSFWIELPLAEAPVQQAERQLDGGPAPVPAAEQADRTGPDLTVLYIEDNLSNLQLVERVLGHRPGVRLISAMRPQLGLDLAGQHHPDLILLDLHLPDMPGEAVLRRLWSSPATADIPVAILSADARPALIERLLGEGVRGFLTKPLDVKELLGLVDGIAAERERAAAR